MNEMKSDREREKEEELNSRIKRQLYVLGRE